MSILIQVDPVHLYLPGSRLGGADPIKFTRELSQFGISIHGIPPLLLVRGKGGAFQIFDGVTRATRVAKFLPGQTIPAIIIDDDPNLDLSRFPKVGDRLP